MSDKPVSDMSFEEAMGTLETVVGQLESGSVPDHQDKLSGPKTRNAAIAEIKCNAINERNVGQIEALISDVFQFDEFEFVVVGRVIGGWNCGIVHQFGNSQVLQNAG